MTTQALHTPLPWKALGHWAIVSKHKHVVDMYRTSADVEELDEIQANVDLIVRSVNTHCKVMRLIEDLVAEYLGWADRIEIDDNLVQRVAEIQAIARGEA